MIGYIMLGTNDFDRAAAFYDALLGTIGGSRMMASESFIAWVAPPDKGALCITKPFDGNAATVGNGVMVALAMDSKEKVNAFYKKAMELGATDEGEPGPRGDSGFYAGYFRDPDGNKLNAFCMG
jgi:catechol 2,3-dioxygenase-like lactoylglutathione lyase family enzyme